jgi:hypothetical protein
MSPMHHAASLISRMTPRKACEQCGKPIVRRRLLARDWEHVRHCSAACRRLSHDRNSRPAGFAARPTFQAA